MVEHQPISAKDQWRLHQFVKEMPTWHLHEICVVCGGIWKGDILVTDIEEPEKFDASETKLEDSMHKK